MEKAIGKIGEFCKSRKMGTMVKPSSRRFVWLQLRVVVK